MGTLNYRLLTIIDLDKARSKEYRSVCVPPMGVRKRSDLAHDNLQIQFER